VTAGLIWIAFAFTPFGMRLIHGKTLDEAKAVSPFTPVGAVEYLRKHPPRGQLFNVMETGDYLAWSRMKYPELASLEIFVNSHVHLVPGEVWRDYMEVINVGAGWESVLDRYGVNTVLADRGNRQALVGRLKRSDKWRRRYEDAQMVILTRRKPIGS
jgi:hypothetical protein